MSSIRIMRLQKELGRLFNAVINNKIRDPRLQWISFSAIKLSSDMQYAKVYFTFMNEKETPESLTKLLTRSSGVFKKEIATAKMMRIIPELTFIYDSVEEEAGKLDKIFAKIEKEKKDY
ncbi:MAG: ribosome-binding factor A [Candidatus Cloacimonadota bacterium]|nr:MAG: ribosome-binding factor A [Candidatus Cloacimonadota bacterium]